MRLFLDLDEGTFWLARDVIDHEGRFIACEHLTAQGHWQIHEEGGPCEIIPADVHLIQDHLDD